MSKAFADRWGVPVRAGSADAVALLDQAVEDLAALAGDPVADAEAAVAADDSLDHVVEVLRPSGNATGPDPAASARIRARDLVRVSAPFRGRGPDRPRNRRRRPCA